MEKYYCPCCDKKVKMKMFGDYSSSGLWCSECGVNFAGFDGFPLELEHDIEMWVFIWEVLDDDKRHRTEYMVNFLNVVGREICERINKYFECEYIEEDFQHCADE